MCSYIMCSLNVFVNETCGPCFQAVNWFLYSYITPIFWVRILYYEKPPIFSIFSYILNIIPIFWSELVAALPKTLFFCSLCSHLRLNYHFDCFNMKATCTKNYLLKYNSPQNIMLMSTFLRIRNIMLLVLQFTI